MLTQLLSPYTASLFIMDILKCIYPEAVFCTCMFTVKKVDKFSMRQMEKAHQLCFLSLLIKERMTLYNCQQKKTTLMLFLLIMSLKSLLQRDEL
jgi:hypothetical protein